MTWVQFSQTLWLEPEAKQPPEALVVVLHDVGDSPASLTSFVARWTASVPTTVFTALAEVGQPDSLTDNFPPQAERDRDIVPEPAMLDRAARVIEFQLEQQLRFYRLDASRLVLVGFGYGGTLALHLLLRWSCAGALTFAARLMRPLPSIIRIDGKVRLIDYPGAGRTGYASMRDIVMSLAARGIDARGVVLAGPALSEEAIRHGGAYLVELVATAQGGRRFRAAQEQRDE